MGVAGVTATEGPQVRIGTRAISKAFGGVRAIREVTFAAAPGEVHAIVGENGAGKSTLMRLIGGAERPDEGTVLLDGLPARFETPRDALDAGIRTIHQEFTLLPDLDVVENIHLGAWIRSPRRLLDWPGMRANARRILDELGVVLPLGARAADLSVPQQQLVEIAKALVSPARVMVMDEPSAVLAGRDLERLFEVIGALAARGTTVIYISHRLPEVFRVAHRVTVLRNGRVVEGGRAIDDTTPRQIVEWMLGHAVEERPPRPGAPRAGGPRLVVDGVGAPGLLSAVSLSVGRGEVVGLAGLVGAGRTSLLRALFGVDGRSGTVTVDGTTVPRADVTASIAAGMALVPEDRKGQGLILPFGVDRNLTLASLGRVARLGFISGPQERSIASDATSRLDIRSAGLGQPAEELSGGNQQKVSLGKWALRRPAVLLLDEPTRGVDVGAKAEIYRLLRGFADEGMAIVVASSELPELYALCDRILVMRDGEVVLEGTPDDLPEDEVLAAATSRDLVHLAEAGEASAVATAPAERVVRERAVRLPSGLDRSALLTWLALAVLCVVVGVLRPSFWDAGNLANILRQASVLGFVALGQAIVVLGGGIDLSVEGAVKLTSLVGAAIMAGALVNLPLALAAMVLVAIAIGATNGLLAARLGASPFIVTLGMLLALQGLSLIIAPSSIGRAPSELVRLYDATVGPLPLLGVLLAVVYVIGWLALTRTAWGRRVYASGGSARSSSLAGIPVTRVRFATYVAGALLCSLAALVLLARQGVGNPQTGDGLGLTSITAVVLGGTSLFGGRGAILGVLGGVLLLTVASTMLGLLQVPTYYQALVSGLVIVTAVALARR